MASDAYLRAVDAIQDVNDSDELLKLNRIINSQFSHATRKEALKFRVGDEVTFEGKKGSILKGDVVKINRKSIGVLVDGFINYRVSPGLLEKVEVTP